MNRVFNLHDARSTRRKRSPLGWLLFGLMVPGCIIDNKHKCGPDEVLVGEYLCTCPDGTVFTPTGCVPCGDHEIASPTGCICEDGYGRSSPTDACAEIPPALGNACTTDTDCPSPYHCQMSAVGGYCTVTGCSDVAPCPGSYNCNQTANPAYCQRPPVGHNKPCTTATDCANTEATFCDTFVTQSCLVQDCTLTPDNCFPGSECCNLSSFGLPNLCVEAGKCTTN